MWLISIQTYLLRTRGSFFCLQEMRNVKFLIILESRELKLGHDIHLFPILQN